MDAGEKIVRTAVREKLPEVAVQLKMGPTRFMREIARNSPLLSVLYPPIVATYHGSAYPSECVSIIRERI